MKLALAPAAVVRASAWPIDVLDAFGADVADVGYAAAVDREREALWERTVGEPQFMRALTFASPAFAARVDALAPRRRQRGKRVRHAETSLYRYLARAASRTTPAGLWAGVGVGRFGAEDRVLARSARYAVAPDLAPFAALLRAVGERTPYRDHARFRLNPTLRALDESGFVFQVRRQDGGLEHRSLDATAGMPALLGRLGGAGSGALGELAARAGSDRATMDALAGAGVLVGGLRLPLRCASPWAALEQGAELLMTRERASWQAALARLHEISVALSSELPRATVADVTRALACAREAISQLVRGFDAPGVAVPTVTLHCDLGLPFELVLGAARRERLLATLDAYHREWLCGASPLSGPRAARRAAILDMASARPIPLGAGLPDALPIEGASPADAGWAPWGTFLGRLGGRALSTVFGVDDNPARAFARHGALLGAESELVEWLAARITALHLDHGVSTADLLVPFARPNVLCRPEVGALGIDPWGADGPDLQGAELRAQQRALVLWVPKVGRLCVLNLTSADVLAGDTVVEQLLYTGFDERVAPGFRASAVMTESEHGPPKHREGLTLSTGAVVRARRTRVAGAHLAPLLAARGPARFALWQALAQRLRWPGRVTLSLDGGTPLLIDPSSPLALEAAFEGARSRAELVVQDADDSAWVQTPRGRHVADVAIPFARSPHAFSALAP
ncbi:MAG: lantibiotic dehydratase [Polyangiaceae bacterium]|nr:lantibiotic dehydratase [Polyangiaceae bacterium]